MVEPLDQYSVPANIRSAVNRGLHTTATSAATSASVSKDAARIRYIRLTLGLLSSIVVPVVLHL